MRKILFTISVILSFHFSSGQDLLSQNKADRLFKTASDLIDHNQFGAARETWDQFLLLADKNDSRRVEAEYMKAFSSLNLYHTDGEKLIEEFVEKNATHPRAGTAYFDLGNFFYSEKNYSRASSYYAKADFTSLGEAQQNVGHFRYGYSLFNLKKLKEALDQFNFIKTQGGQYGPAGSYYAGFIEFSQADYENAKVDLKRAEQSEAYKGIVPPVLANVYYKQKNYDELLTYAKTLSGKDDISNSEEIALLSAEAYFKKSDYKNSLNGYREYVESRKGTADRGVLSRAGYSAFITGQDADALTYFKASASDRDSVGFYSSYYLGMLYLKQQQKPMALTAFDNARKFSDDKTLAEESTFQFAKISYDMGQPDKAINEFEELLKRSPSSDHVVEVKELLSQAYVNANNYNKAIQYIESLPKRGPAIDRAFQKATFLKGTELFNKEDYAQAIQFFDKSLQSPIDQNYVAEASFWSAETYSIGKRYDLAIPKYQQVIGLSGYTNQEIILRARYGLGYAHFNVQQYDNALTSFKEFVNKSTKTSPNFTDGVLRLADSYYASKSYSDALVNYRKAIQLNSIDIDYAHLQAGVVLSIMRNYAEAANELNDVIKNYPQSRFFDEALFQRAQLDFEQGNYSSSVSGFTKLIGSSTTSRFLPYAYLRRASSYYNLKEYGKTADDYISLVEKFPTHPITNDALLPLQEALTLSGRSGDFANYIGQFKTANPGAKGIESVEFEAAKSFYFNQDYTQALANLGEYVKSYPDSPRVPEAKYYTAESYYRLKDMVKALAIYDEIAAENTFALTNKVTARIAELEFKQGNYEKAIPQFRKLSKIASNKKEQFNAWSGLMESSYVLAQYDSVDAYARLILEKGKVNAGAENKASLFLGKSAMARGDYDGAKDEFLNTLNTARDEYGAEAKYLLAEIFFLSKDSKQCYETCVSLNTDFAAYPEWVGKSYLLLSDNFLAMGDLFQAKGTLKSLIDNFPLQIVKDQANERLKKLEEQDLKKQKAVQSDTLDN